MRALGLEYLRSCLNLKSILLDQNRWGSICYTGVLMAVFYVHLKTCRNLSKRNIWFWTHATFFISFLQGGMYLFQIMDFYAASGLSLLWICFFETIAVSWFYGAGRFSKNIEQMLGHRPAFFIFWHYCWLIFAPVVMGVRIYCSIINTYN